MGTDRQGKARHAFDLSGRRPLNPVIGCTPRRQTGQSSRRHDDSQGCDAARQGHRQVGPIMRRDAIDKGLTAIERRWR